MNANRARWLAAFVLAAWPLFAQRTLPNLQQTPQAVAGPEDSATGSIEGAVSNATTGEPVRKAQVHLGGAARQGGAQTNLTAATDASGHFSFRALPAGAYWLNTQHPGYGAPEVAMLQVTLATGEQKGGIEIRLPPQGGISGHVVDEYGVPVGSCNVQAMQFQTQGGRRRLVGRGGTSTNAKGEYEFQGLEKGRYYVSARCGAEVEAPHALMRVRDPRIPYFVYPLQFYPGVPGPIGATRLAVTPGVEVQGIDFQVRPILGTTVRGHIDVAGAPVADRNVQIQLRPPSGDLTEVAQFGAGLDQRTGDFQIRGVTPGSYLLVAGTFGNGPLYQGQVPVDIGAGTPDPIRLVLTPAPELSGAVEVEGDSLTPIEQLRVFLQPLDVTYFGQQPQAQVGKDGTFTLAGVAPGRWRLSVMGPGYAKSLTIGEKDVSPYAFDLAPGAGGPLRIVVSNKTGQVEVGLSTPSPGAGGMVSFLLVPTDPERLDGGAGRLISGDRGGQTTMGGILPGRYRLFALDTAEGWKYLQQPEVLKALESHSQSVEVAEGETARATADLIEAGDLERAVQEAQ